MYAEAKTGESSNKLSTDSSKTFSLADAGKWKGTRKSDGIEEEAEVVSDSIKHHNDTSAGLVMEYVIDDKLVQIDPVKTAIVAFLDFYSNT